MARYCAINLPTFDNNNNEIFIGVLVDDPDMLKSETQNCVALSS